MSTTRDRLAGLLRGPEPPGVAALSAVDRDALAAVVEQALARQRQQLAASSEAMLRNIPFPVRSLARKVLFG